MRVGRRGSVGGWDRVEVLLAALYMVILSLQHLRSLEGLFWREIRTPPGGLGLLYKNPFEDLFGGALIARLRGDREGHQQQQVEQRKGQELR